jgi:hypothetical protein
VTVHELPTPLPADHLCPIWRRVPTATGIASMALDPREAQLVLERGWAVLDGVKWRASLAWNGIVEGDGRVDVRLTRVPTIRASANAELAA